MEAHQETLDEGHGGPANSPVRNSLSIASKHEGVSGSRAGPAAFKLAQEPSASAAGAATLPPSRCPTPRPCPSADEEGPLSTPATAHPRRRGGSPGRLGI